MRQVLLVLLAASALVAFNIVDVARHVGFLHDPAGFDPQFDHFRYLAMAKEPLAGAPDPLAHEPPFCYRVLTPWLARLLTHAGLDLNFAFYLLTNVFLVLFLVTLYFLLEAGGLGSWYPALGMALAGMLQGAVRWYEYQYWMTDPLSLFLVTLAFLLIKRRAWLAVTALGAVAVANRETFLLVIPFLFLTLLRQEGLRRALGRTALVAGPTLAVFFVLRASIPAAPGPPVFALAEAIGRWRLDGLLDGQAYSMTLGSFGVLFPLCLLFPGRLLGSWRALLAEASVVAGAYASLLLGMNTDRLLAYALPVVVPLAMGNLREFQVISRLPLAGVGVAALAIQFYVSRETVYYEACVQPASRGVVTVAALSFVAARAIVSCRRKSAVRESRDRA